MRTIRKVGREIEEKDKMIHNVDELKKDREKIKNTMIC